MGREWLLYVAIMLVVVVTFFRDRPMLGIIAGLVVSGPLYLGLGYVLAKFGYQRKSWGELREQSGARGGKSSTARAAAAPPGPRPKAAPTSRTGATSTRPGPRNKRR
jgi:hypothetical protein